MIHRITPRFKSLLHEMHHIGNATHAMLLGYAPTIIISTVLLVGGILTAAGDSADGNVEVPVWSFAAVIQPMTSMLAYISAFGNMNLAIERDVDQDVSCPSELCERPLCSHRLPLCANLCVVSPPLFVNTYSSPLLFTRVCGADRGDEHPVDVLGVARPELAATANDLPRAAGRQGVLVAI